MLMKWLVAGSIAAADSWNRRFARLKVIPEEVAIRLPNAIVGSLTTLVLFFMAGELFDRHIAWISALLWASGIQAVTFNRVEKEDTLLVFFTWCGYYFYLKAKKLGGATRREERLYGLSGASFGLMLASKYFPHYLGLNFLYYFLLHRLRGNSASNRPLTRRDLIHFFAAFVLCFLLINPLILVPRTIAHDLAYAGERTVTHHGYLMIGKVYHNNLSHPWGGTPPYFYALFLLIKTPLPVLLALILGGFEVFSQKSKPGPFFVSFTVVMWMVPFSMLGAKWLRYVLQLMPSIYLMSAIGIARIVDAASSWLTAKNAPWAQKFAPATTVGFFCLTPLWSVMNAAPFYSLYLNPLGLDRVAYFFPPDEIYEAGLGQAIEYVARVAPPGSRIGGDSPAAFKYYLDKHRRPDLRYFNLSDRGWRGPEGDFAYVVLEQGSQYFENLDLFEEIERRYRPEFTAKVGAATASRVYRIEN